MAKLRSLANRQHFHMKSILKCFSHNEETIIIDKITRQEFSVLIDDNCFIAYKAWSNKIEEVIGRDDIEKKMLGQIRHIKNHGTISCHQTISKYDLLWKLRHHHATNPSGPETILKGLNFGKLPKDVLWWSNQHGKVPIHGDGTVDGMYCATMKIEKELNDNWPKYEPIKWELVYSPSGGFISADCYSSTIIPISDTIVLVGRDQNEAHKGTIEINEDDVRKLNELAFQQCKNFCFRLKIAKATP